MAIVETPEGIRIKCDHPGCEATFEDQARHDYHVSTKHVGKETQFKVNTSPPKREAPATPPVKATATTTKKVAAIPTAANNIDSIRLKRQADWTNYIVKDANPFLFSRVKAFCEIPDGWEDQVVAEFQTPDGKTVKLWEPSLRTRLTFNEDEAKKLADAAARFSVSPMGMAITAWLEANAGLIALGLAGWVAGKYGYRIMQTKTEIKQFKEAMEVQKNMMQAQAAAMGADQNGASEAA